MTDTDDNQPEEPEVNEPEEKKVEPAPSDDESKQLPVQAESKDSDSKDDTSSEEKPEEPAPSPAPEPKPAPEPEPEPEPEPVAEEGKQEASEEPADAPAKKSKPEEPKPSKPEPESKPAEQPAEEPSKPPKQPAKSKKPPKEPKEDKDRGSDEIEVDEDFKYIVRIVNTDLNGHKTVELGLTGVTGIGSRLAAIIADKSGLDRSKKLGNLTDEEVEQLEEQVKKIPGIMPSWLTNRQKDSVTGDDTHILGGDLQLILRDDINRLKMIRSYRGIRHEQGQKVRGQRTRANGRSGTTVGVVKKAVRQKQSGDKKK
jgi:small subunit ribosomal protein S13